MQNIGNITLASWPVSRGTERETVPVFHFAVRQSKFSLDFHLTHIFRQQKVVFHHFTDFEDLSGICIRHPIDAVVMASKSDFMRELDMVHAIKQNILLSIMPVILYHPLPSETMLIAAYESGVEDFIHGEWIDKLVEVRIRSVIERSRRDLAVNPTTRLPGPAMIELEIERQMRLGEEFAVCYADLDNFKAFNDHYGYSYADSIIKLVGKILRDVVYDICPEGFVGHIAGDDFICVVPRDVVDRVCTWVIKSFDAFIPYRYAEEDRRRGYIETTNRRGSVEKYPILTISIAVIINENGKFQHIGELAKMLADLKTATKALPGSNYMIERRDKY